MILLSFINTMSSNHGNWDGFKATTKMKMLVQRKQLFQHFTYFDAKISEVVEILYLNCLGNAGSDYKSFQLQWSAIYNLL